MFQIGKAFVRGNLFCKQIHRGECYYSNVKCLEQAIKSLSVVLSVKSTLHASLKVDLGYQEADFSEKLDIMNFDRKLLGILGSNLSRNFLVTLILVTFFKEWDELIYYKVYFPDNMQHDSCFHSVS